MSVRVNIPTHFQNFTGGKAFAEVQGSTVGECIKDLDGQFPGIASALLQDGKLLDYIDIYVNLESSYPEELARPVKDGDELHITLFVIAGG